MLHQLREKIKCPNCEEEKEVILWEKVIVDINPDLHEKLLEGKLNFLKCSSCGYETRIDIPLIYQDNKKKVFIHFAPDYPIGEEKNLLENLNGETKSLLGESYYGRMRVVFDHKALCEKAKIFEDEIDDRTIECCKIIARTQLKLMEGLAYYIGKTKNEVQFVYFENDKVDAVNEFSVPMEMYEEVKKLVDEKDKLSTEDTDGFRLIDLKYAVNILQ